MSLECVYGSTTLEIHKNPNIKDGILELLLEIECLNNWFMVLQSWKFISMQNVSITRFLQKICDINCQAMWS